MKHYMAIDQYGQTIHGLGEHPRKDLLAKLGYKSASRMYKDFTDGSSRHVGYVVAGRWFTLYEVTPFTGTKYTGTK